MDEVQKSEMKTGAIIGIVVASIIIGYLGVLMTSDETLDGLTWFIGGGIASLIVMFVGIGVYGAVIANNDKEAQNQRVAQAATEYLRDKERAGK